MTPLEEKLNEIINRKSIRSGDMNLMTDMKEIARWAVDTVTDHKRHITESISDSELSPQGMNGRMWDRGYNEAISDVKKDAINAGIIAE